MARSTQAGRGDAARLGALVRSTGATMDEVDKSVSQVWFATRAVQRSQVRQRRLRVQFVHRGARRDFHVLLDKAALAHGLACDVSVNRRGPPVRLVFLDARQSSFRWVHALVSLGSTRSSRQLLRAIPVALAGQNRARLPKRRTLQRRVARSVRASEMGRLPVRRRASAAAERTRLCAARTRNASTFASSPPNRAECQRERQRVHGETARVGDRPSMPSTAYAVVPRAVGDGNGEGSVPGGGKRARPGGARPVVEHRERRVGRTVARRTAVPPYLAFVLFSPPNASREPARRARRTRRPSYRVTLPLPASPRADGGDAPRRGRARKRRRDARQARRATRGRPIAPAGCEHVRGVVVVRVRVCFRKLAKSFAEAERGPRAGALAAPSDHASTTRNEDHVQNADRPVDVRGGERPPRRDCAPRTTPRRGGDGRAAEPPRRQPARDASRCDRPQRTKTDRSARPRRVRPALVQEAGAPCAAGGKRPKARAPSSHAVGHGGLERSTSPSFEREGRGVRLRRVPGGARAKLAKRCSQAKDVTRAGPCRTATHSRIRRGAAADRTDTTPRRRRSA